MANSIMQVDKELFVTHIEREGSLIKIYAQTDKNITVIEKLFYRLKQVLDTNDDLKPQMMNDLKVGLLCCAKYDDNNYYRAKIVDVSRVNESNQVKLYFIDYGNVSDVCHSEIRLYSKLVKSISDERYHQILDLPFMAKEFYLGGITVKHEFNERILEMLKQNLTNSNIFCSVVEVSGKQIITKILKANCNPVEFLVRSNLGNEVSFSRFQKELGNQAPPIPYFHIPPPTMADISKQPPIPRMPNFTQPPPSSIMTQGIPIFPQMNQSSINNVCGNLQVRPNIPGMQLRKPELPLITVPQFVPYQFKTEMLEVGSSYQVYVSHVEDGPHAFSIQIQSEVQDTLMKMMLEMDKHQPKPISTIISPGSICLCRYEDRSLCRAIVTNVMGDNVKVHFADFGNSEVVSYSEIYEIPPHFVKPKVMSHRFALSNIKDVTYSEEEKALFKKLVANKNNLHLKVNPPEANPMKQYCDLYLNCKHIKVILCELSQTLISLRYTPLPLPTNFRGTPVKVVVPFVLNPGRFFVQFETNKAQLNDIMSKIAKHCEAASPIPLSDLKAGDPCCALYEDETWYRAEIVRVSHDKVLINFVDYGNQEEVEPSNLRIISPDLVRKTPAQALVCCLKGYELRYQVSEDISNRLEELILEKSLTMVALGSTDTSVLIVELSDNGQDIGTLLDAQPASVPAAVTSQQVDYREDSYPSNNNRDISKSSDHRRARDEGGQSWRSHPQENFATTRNGGTKHQNDEESNPWDNERSPRDEDAGGRFSREGNRRERFNRDENQSGRYNRDENGGKRFGERKGRFHDDNTGASFGDSEPRYGKYNSTDSNDKPWNRGGDRENNDEGRNKGWGERNGGSSNGWKGREGGTSGTWKERGERRNRFDGDNDYKGRDGGHSRNSYDGNTSGRSWDKGNSFGKPKKSQPKVESLGGIPYPKVKVGMTENTEIVFTTSPAEFYVQLTSTNDELTQLMERIATVCESGEAVDMTSVQEKTACLAKYSEDESWYRGYIVNKTMDSTNVQFVDYGNEESVPVDKLKVLPEDMATLAAQAVKCRLYGVPDTAETDRFTELTSDKKLLTQFLSLHFLSKSFQVVLIDETSGTNINIALGAEEEEVLGALSKEEEEESSPLEHKPNTVYIFGDSHARDQAGHLNYSLNGAYNIKSTCCPGWPLNEVVGKAIVRINEFLSLTVRDFIVIIGGSNDTSERHKNILCDLYKQLFGALKNTNIIVCETPFRFDEVEKNTEIATTNNAVAELCVQFPNATFLPIINSLQRHHFTKHGLHMYPTGKKILSGLISASIKQNSNS